MSSKLWWILLALAFEVVSQKTLLAQEIYISISSTAERRALSFREQEHWVRH
jgi:hypothetical protein